MFVSAVYFKGGSLDTKDIGTKRKHIKDIKKTEEATSLIKLSKSRAMILYSAGKISDNNPN